MRIFRETILAVLLVLPAGSRLRAQIVPNSSSEHVTSVDCGGLKLAAASGVPDGPVHGYKFQGICKILSINHVEHEAAFITYDTDDIVTVEGLVWTIASARWDSKTGELVEKLQTQGKYAGELAMVLKCVQDPVITSVACYQVAYKNTTNWPGFDGAWNQARPMTRGKTTLVEAAAFSKKSPPPQPTSPPAVPPPPAPKTEKKPVISRLPRPTAAAPVAVQPVGPLAPRTAARRDADRQEVPLALRSRIELASGRSLTAHREPDGLRWAILGPRGEVMRVFPAESRAFRSRSGMVTVDWGGGVYDAGPARR